MDYDRYEIEDDSYYLFTCAELKAREYEFVERARFERMLESEDMDSFLKVLGETVYSPSVSAISSGLSFEKVMMDNYGTMLDYLEERLRDEHRMLSHILFFEEILHNMKVMFKSVVLRKDLSSLFIPVIYVLETQFNDDEESMNLKDVLKLTIIVLGLAPATRNTVRMVLGI